MYELACHRDITTIKGANNQKVSVHIIRPRNVAKPCCFKGHPVLFNCHGGGGFSGGADQEKAWTSRLASSCEIVIINIDYGLAPESQYAESQLDIVAAIKHFYANHKQYGLDKNKFGIIGTDVGAAYAMAAARRLALEENRGCFNFCHESILKLMILLSPRANDKFPKLEPIDLEWWEAKPHKHAMDQFKILTKDQDEFKIREKDSNSKAEEDKIDYLFPAKMDSK